MAIEDREPIVPGYDERRVRPWYRSTSGFAIIGLIGVLLLGFALYAAMEIGADQSCADVGGQRTNRVCVLPTQVVVTDPTDEVVVPSPVPGVVVPSPVTSPVMTEEQNCLQSGGTWDGSVCLP
jgi:hypothetical protein